MQALSLIWSLILAASPQAQEDFSSSLFIDDCRKTFSTWNEQAEALKVNQQTDPGPSAEKLNLLEHRAGRCLEALENDLGSIEKTENWRERVSTEAQGVEVRVADLKASLGKAEPQWDDKISLKGNAIGAPVDFRAPGDYLLDAAAVSKTWSTLVARYAPVIDELILRMKRHAGLAVDTRECRSLWLLARSTKPAKNGDAPPSPLPQDQQRIGFCLQALMNDLETLDKHLRSLATPPRSVKAADVKGWSEPTLQGEAIGSVQSVEVDIDKYLVDAYLVHQYKTWREIEMKVAPGLKGIVESVMSFRGLRDLFSLLLSADMAFLDMGNDGDDVFVTEDAKAKTFPTFELSMESDHFLAEQSPVAHVSFGGGIAALPALNLLNEQPAEGSTTAADTTEPIYPTFQQALVWDLNALGQTTFKRFELSYGVFVGQSILLDDKSLVERDEDFVGVPLENGSGRAATFKGFLVEMRVYDLDWNIIHGEHSYLNPRFSIAYGQRWNDRFVAEGEDSRDWRKSNFFRFRWNIRNSLVSRDKFQGPLLVTFSFGVEREWWPGDTGLPTITTVFFSGDFDLKKVIKSKE
jgi:hypothetical protein